MSGAPTICGQPDMSFTVFHTQETCETVLPTEHQVSFDIPPTLSQPGNGGTDAAASLMTQNF